MSSNTKNNKELLILRAAVRVFGQSGYHGSSIADIASEAGIATGTIYLYFKKKEELIIALFQRLIGDYLIAGRPRLEAMPAGFPRLQKLIAMHLEFFEGDHEVAAAFQVHLREANPEIREGIRPILVQYFEMIEHILLDGIEAKDFDPGLDVRLARKLVFGGLDEVVTSWVLSGHRYSLMNLADPLFELIARAVRGGAESRRHPVPRTDSLHGPA